MPTTDERLAELLGKNAELYAAYEVWANAQNMLIVGSVDDPESYNAGGVQGGGGFYYVPILGGDPILVPSLARLAAAGTDPAALDALLAVSVEAVAADRAAVEAARTETLEALPGVRQDIANIPAVAADVPGWALVMLDALRGIGGGLSDDWKRWIIAGLTTELKDSGAVHLAPQFGGGGVDLQPGGSARLFNENGFLGVKPDGGLDSPHMGTTTIISSELIAALMLSLGEKLIAFHADGGAEIGGFRLRPINGGAEMLTEAGELIMRRQNGVVNIDGLNLAGADLGLPLKEVDAPGYKFVFLYEDGSWDTALTEEGEWIGLAGPMPPAPPALIKPKDTYVRGGELLPLLPDMTRMVAWGSSSMDYMVEQFGDLAASFGAAYYNGGKAGEIIEHTAARMGARPPLMTPSGGVIPASGPVAVTISNVPLTRGNNLRPTVGQLGGVAGTWAWGGSGYIFTRSAAGDPVEIGADTPFISLPGSEQRAAIAFINGGKNNVGDSAFATDHIIAVNHQMFDFLAPLVKRAIMIGHFANAGSNSAHKAQIAAINVALAARYGEQFFDLQAYLMGAAIWTNAGLTPTSDDLAAQAAGEIAPSLRRDNNHMNVTAQTAVAARLQERITALGWYQ